jgi:predicted RNase H-like HicB family nuclease
MPGHRIRVDRIRQRGTVCDVTEEVQVTIAYEDGGDGWILARVLEVPAAVDQGRTREEARANVLAALGAVFEMWPDERPKRLEHETVTVSLSP